MSEKIGVFICECGSNIKDAIDIKEIITGLVKMENVVLVKTFGIFCSDEGKELIKKEIKEGGLTRIVIAACSPKEHESTFRKVLEDAGLNPFFLHITNIREQCVWVVNDKKKATRKAEYIIKAGVKRVVYHEPLETKEIECQPDVLVVGAGITGISAALALSQKDRKVYLVEKSPCIGGKVALYHNIFPSLECASCMLGPKLDEVLHNKNIELFICSEVTEVLGSYGSFIFKVKKKARFVDTKICIGCGACFDVCPVKVKNEYNEGIDERKAIYIPYNGSLPHAAVIDKENCLHFTEKKCDACQKVCPFCSVSFDDADQEQEIKAGAAILATGFDLWDVKRIEQYGYGKIDNVYTGLEFERLLDPGGSIAGKIQLKNGSSPKKIALLHCAGSRTDKYHEYCSAVCCSYLLKFAHLIKNTMPDVHIIEFYSDMCLPGKYSQKFFNKLAKHDGIEFVRMKSPDSIEVNYKNGKILIKYDDVKGKPKNVTSDMVILAPSLQGARGSQDVARIFDISSDKYGFFREEHSKLAPVSTTTKGIFIAGCASEPMDIHSSVTQGEAAAGLVLSKLVPGEKMLLEAMASVVDEMLCSGCKICIGLCPFKAITYSDEEKQAMINEILCLGCGVCASACPAGAIAPGHFTDKQIYNEIFGIIK
jgi:heterodisulfide reductase subunit A